MTNFILETVKPKILVYKNTSNQPYRTFSSVSSDCSGANLQSYTWSRATGSFSGSFSFQIKEDIVNPLFVSSNIRNKPFLDVVEPLDIVEIIEGNDEKMGFIGVITDIIFSATANGKKTITISGKGIEHLLELYVISMDATAMAFTSNMVNNESLEYNFAAKLNSGQDPISIKIMLKAVFEEFKNVATRYPGISSTGIGDMIKNWIGEDMFFVDDDLKFEYPISNNLISNSNINFPNYVSQLLPKPLYEFYGAVVEGKPKIVCRKVPFTADRWVSLPSESVSPDTLLSYTTKKSCDEVYSVFIPYVEGSAMSAEFYQATEASVDGYENAYIHKAKLQKYGYRPLFCTFSGYKTPTGEKKQALRFEDLGKELGEMYGVLDEMFDANFMIVNSDKVQHPVLGGRLIFGGGEFYISGEEHSWSYGGPAKIEFQCERGGVYNKGVFQPLKSLSSRGIEFL